MSQRVCELLNFPHESVLYSLYVAEGLVRKAPIEISQRIPLDKRQEVITCRICDGISAKVKKAFWDLVELYCLMLYGEGEIPDERVIDACSNQKDYFLEADFYKDGIKIYLVSKQGESKALLSDTNIESSKHEDDYLI